ncbi:MAG: pyridoxamine 5'-phosphate oxidase family protein [Polyangiaceae bacterium]|jgi:general stress protein 26|nr:pyridoxamine 5'-phosphate oxidase family protein [Polyangiaceae bacterium]
MSDTSKTDSTKHLFDLLSSFRIGMVVVRAPEGLMSARPMAISERQGLDFWFMTSRQTGLVEALRDRTEALVTMQDSTRYVTLNGHARLEDDRARIHRNFSETDKVWFPQGPDDPNIVLAHFRPEHAEYWDNSGLRGVRFAVEATKAYLKGEPLPQGKLTNHGEVQVSPTRP